MPIVDVQLVAGEGGQTDKMAASIANALAVVFKSQPGTVWVRLSFLPSSAYAENGINEAVAREAFQPHIIGVEREKVCPLFEQAMQKGRGRWAGRIAYRTAGSSCEDA